MKQSKLRRRRVFRYAILYFVMLVVFVGLIVGPIVAGKHIPASITDSLSSTSLVQPTGQDNDDTIGTEETGVRADGYTGAGLKTMTATADSARKTKSSSDNDRLRLF